MCWHAHRASTLPCLRLYHHDASRSHPGVLLPKEEIEAISEACGAAGAWLVVDGAWTADETHAKC